MQSDDYRLIPLVEFKANVILTQNITNRSQTSKPHTSNDIFTITFGKLFFYSSFYIPDTVDTDLTDYKMILNQSFKYCHLGNAFKSAFESITDEDAVMLGLGAWG